MVFQMAVSERQFSLGEIETNVKEMQEDVRLCKERHPGVQLVVFPELSATGYFLTSSLHEVAEEKDGSIFKQMSHTAKRHGVYLLYGYVEKDALGKIYDSCMLINAEGECAANYRKIHLTPPEKEFFTAGDDPVVVDTDLGKVALVICWDLAFPEYSLHFSKNQVDLVLAPSAWESPYESPFVKFGSARALDSTTYLAASNHLGTSGELEFFGQSTVYSPEGNVLPYEDHLEDKLYITTIDFNKTKQLKEDFYTMNGDRRRDVFE